MRSAAAATQKLGSLEDAFAEVAADWAAAEGILPEAFAAMGVDRDVLGRAGMSVAPAQRRTAARTTTAKTSKAKTTSSKATSSKAKSGKAKGARKPAAKKSTGRKSEPVQVASPPIPVADLPVGEDRRNRLAAELAAITAADKPLTSADLADLADLAGSSRPTVNADLRTLVEAGLIIDTGPVDIGKAGRQPNGYTPHHRPPAPQPTATPDRTDRTGRDLSPAPSRRPAAARSRTLR